MEMFEGIQEFLSYLEEQLDFSKEINNVDYRAEKELRNKTILSN